VDKVKLSNFINIINVFLCMIFKYKIHKTQVISVITPVIYIQQPLRLPSLTVNFLRACNISKTTGYSNRPGRTISICILAFRSASALNHIRPINVWILIRSSKQLPIAVVNFSHKHSIWENILKWKNRRNGFSRSPAGHFSVLQSSCWSRSVCRRSLKLQLWVITKMKYLLRMLCPYR
jgi:hypothetical protein